MRGASLGDVWSKRRDDGFELALGAAQGVGRNSRTLGRRGVSEYLVEFEHDEVGKRIAVVVAPRARQ
jgi:hypothetical protein